MQGRPVRVVEPVAGVKGQQLDLCPLGQIRGLIDNEPAGLYARPNRHAPSLAPDLPPNKRLQPTAAGATPRRYG